MPATRILLLFLFIPFVSPAQRRSFTYQVHFERNKHELSIQSRETLSLVADTLMGEKDYLIYLNGHTDSDADSSFNQILSLKRSIAVKEFLVQKGIRASLFTVRAMGEAQPLTDNTTPLKKAKNRRVELVVLFQQKPREQIIEVKSSMPVTGCKGDTTILFEGGYRMTLSKCDWEKNSECLRIEKKLIYNDIKVKENWLKKHLGFKDYRKVISYQPHYRFYVVSCQDSCFQQAIQLYIPLYQAPGLSIDDRYTQKKNDRNGAAALVFKKARQGDSAGYVAEVYCPGTLNWVVYTTSPE